MKVGTKVMPLFLCGAGYSFLFYPLDSDTGQRLQQHRYSCQSDVLNTAAVQNDVVHLLGRDWTSHYLKGSPIEIQTRLRSVYGGDAMYTSSDVGSVFLRAVKRTLVTVLTRPNICAATSGTMMESVS